jgi:hypothetical protein
LIEAVYRFLFLNRSEEEHSLSGFATKISIFINLQNVLKSRVNPCRAELCLYAFGHGSTTLARRRGARNFGSAAAKSGPQLE